MMKRKKAVASLLPYAKTSKGFMFFLQQRDMEPHLNAGLLDLFGGAVEAGETVEQALVREMQEELEYQPKNPLYFSRYENGLAVCDVFIEEVGQDFDKRVHVHEGEYGIFLSLEQAQKSRIFAQTLLVIEQVSRMLSSQ